MAKRFALMLAVVAAGAVLGLPDGTPGRVTGSSWYQPAVAALLAVGLYASTRSIDPRLLRTDGRTVLAAVTVGVLLKSVVIGAVLYGVFGRPMYLVLGIAVAQIDPLAVAALGRSSRLSARGRGLLLAWASFDDPVTTLLTIYAAAVAVSLQGGGRLHLGVSAFTVDLLGNLVVGGLALLAARAARSLPARRRFWIETAVLAAVFAVAVTEFWVLAVAIAGLGLRPEPPGRSADRPLERAVDVAFVLASLLLGVVLAGGVRPLQGVVLGVVAFAAQAIVSVPLTRAQSRPDKVLLAIAQQNGITAISLALLLEPVFPESVAVVAPAILVVNTLYLVTNAAAGARAFRGRPLRGADPRPRTAAEGRGVAAPDPHDA
ncbi:hypothetical protein DZF91_35495 [Actinomadura logoneensis]|uniref:Cation/H+ exchanger domain-containing protein n=1 Tax=Actinomadura logoneensis TaxID=2293572 RepID=A0A372JAU6_9ACTN|nr:cation:proton antiporter [Actinomadura logoneensis]RFU36946.1 hypothetical protein DZF91_35495 [Actinomadura logoneensis]